MLNGNGISIDIAQSEYLAAKIKVIGVGGGGCNAISNMFEGNLKGVELIAANTDSQALAMNSVKTKLQLGPRTTKGLGAGSDPEIGRKAAEESEQDIIEFLKDSEMIFVTCGMGGGTGSGAAPVVARLAKESGALVVGIVTRPFEYEGKVRHLNANRGIEELSRNVDAIIVIPNQKIYEIIGDDTDIDEALKQIDQVLFNSTRGISDIINNAGKFNVDFADVRTIMKDKGQALMGIGNAEGPNRAKEATLNAINSPLLGEINIKGAKGLLVNITGGKVIKQSEVPIILNTIQEITGDDINLIHGIVKTGEETDSLSVTVVATGFGTPHIKGITKPQKFTDIFGKNEVVYPPKDTKPTSKEISDIYIQRTFQGTKQDASNEGMTIPRGHDLASYNQPAILRKDLEEQFTEDYLVTTFPNETERERVNSDQKEELILENSHYGIDILNMQVKEEVNNFSKWF